MVKTTLAGLLAFMPLVGQADETFLADLSDRISRCIDRQFADDASPAIFADIDLTGECPQLAERLAEQTDFISSLPLDRDSSNLAELADLRYFIAQLRHSNQSGVELDVSDLHSILEAALRDKKQEKQTSWWKQFIDWLTRHDPTDNDEQDLRWLDKFLENITLSASTGRLILYTSALLIAALALALIWHEIRLGTASGRSLFRRRTAANTREENLSGVADTLSVNPDTLPVSLPQLLNVCIDYLINQRRLPERRSQTNQEFLSHLQVHGDAVAPQFDALCQQAERVLYGDRRPEPSVIERCLDEAKSLLSEGPDRQQQPAVTNRGSAP